MTQSIDERHRKQAAHPASAGEPGPAVSQLVRWIRIFTGTTLGAGLVVFTWALAHDLWRLAVVGMVLVFLAAVSAGVWTVHLLLADRNEFYRRGLLEGWRQGWNGQPPDVDDPLLRTPL
jgi:hypothetical protein